MKHIIIRWLENPWLCLTGQRLSREEKITSSNAALFASIHFGSSLEPDTEPNIKFLKYSFVTVGARSFKASSSTMTYDSHHGRSQENLLVTHNLFSAQSAGVGTFGVKCVNYGVDDVSLNYIDMCIFLKYLR